MAELKRKRHERISALSLASGALWGLSGDGGGSALRYPMGGSHVHRTHVVACTLCNI